MRDRRSKTPKSSSLPSRCCAYISARRDSGTGRVVRHSGTRWSALSVSPCPVKGLGRSSPSGRPMSTPYGTAKASGSSAGNRSTMTVSSVGLNGLGS